MKTQSFKNSFNCFLFILKLAFLFSVLLLGSFSVFAIDAGGTTNPYSFGGACSASQGSWTRLALEQTNKIRAITKNLKNDENCQALGKNLQTTISQFESQLNNLDNNMSRSQTYKNASEVESSEKTLQALSHSLSDPSIPNNQKNGISGVIMNQLQSNSIKRGQISSVFSNLLLNQSGKGLSISSVMNDFKVAADVGYQMFNGIIDAIPKVYECQASNQAYAQFAGATLQTAAALFSSGTDPGSTPNGIRVTNIINKLAQFARDYHFSKVLGELNETEYITSISCLMEVATDNYCATRDSQILLEEGLKSFNIIEHNEDSDSKNTTQKSPALLSPEDPLQGYYILTQHLPHITDWLQKVQVGVSPKLPTDAFFKNSVIDEVMDFYKTVNIMIADFEKAKKTIYDQTDVVAQRNTLIDLLISTSDKMGLATSFNNGGPARKNFFNYRIQGIYIPFVLIGRDIKDVPKVITSTDGTFRISPEDYIRQEGTKEEGGMPEFANPKVLLDILEFNMNKIINETNLAVIEYHNTWLIVDPLSIYDQAVTSMRYSVYDSLKVISRYLENLGNRFAKLQDKHPEIQTSLISIADLKSRMDNILDSFNTKINSKDQAVVELVNEAKFILNSTLKDLHSENSNGAPLPEMEQREKRSKAVEEFKLKADQWAKKFADSLYNNYSMLLARSGFLSNRLTTLILQDYTLQAKYGDDNDGLSPYAKEIMIGLGKSAFDLLVQTAGDPATLQIDIATALNVQKRNIEALEALFKEKMVATIARMNLYDQYGRKPSKKELLEDSQLRNYFDSRHPLKQYTLPTSITDQEYQQILDKNSLCYGILDCSSPLLSALFFGNIYELTKADIYYWLHQERYNGPSIPILWRFGDESLSPDTEFGSIGMQRDLFCIQSLAFNDWKSFYPLCRKVILKSPLLPKGSTSPSYLNVNYSEKLSEKAKEDLKMNHSLRICAFRDYARRNKIQWLTLNQKKLSLEVKKENENPATSTIREDQSSPLKVEDVPLKRDKSTLIPPRKPHKQDN